MRSYFGAPRGLSTKTRRLVQLIADFDYILTSSELEALVLEMNLIKQYRPKYNVLLKDDKSYPYIKVTLNENLATHFHDAQSARMTMHATSDRSHRRARFANTLKLLNKLFSFRPPYDCSDQKFESHRRAERPCMYYDIKRCLGPCVPGLTSAEEYRAAINGASLFLQGRSEQIINDLRKRMREAAENMEYERAAYVRDQIQALESILERQKVLKTASTDQDVIAFAREEGSAVVQVFFVRGGKLIGAEPFTLEGTEDSNDGRIAGAVPDPVL